MPPESPIASVVWLVGADDMMIGVLQPAAETLASFGIRTETALLTPDGPLPATMGEACAIIVTSPDATLPAALAERTELLVIRVPTEADGRSGLELLNDGSDNLPAGPPDGVFATMAIGQAGAANAALFVVASLAADDPRLRAAWAEFRARQTQMVLQHPPLTI